METKGKQTQTEVLVWLEDLEKEQDRLTDWERDFVASLQDRYIGKSLNLTEGQYEKLKRLWERYF